MFSDYNLVLEAAVQGMGVALGRTGLIECSLADGSLVAELTARIYAQDEMLRRTRKFFERGAQPANDFSACCHAIRRSPRRPL
jgi:hypothetical protein